MSDDQIVNERYYRSLESHRDVCQKSVFYSIQRIDLIVISLATGTVVLVLSQINEVCCHKKELFSIIIGLCVCSIVVNLVSQFLAHYVNKQEVKWAMDEMTSVNAELNGDIIENKVKSTKHFNDLIAMTNYVSVALWVVSAIILVISL